MEGLVRIPNLDKKVFYIGTSGTLAPALGMGEDTELGQKSILHWNERHARTRLGIINVFYIGTSGTLAPANEILTKS